MDFSRTSISLNRSLTSYSKIRPIMSWLLRDKPMFFAPIRDKEILLHIGCGARVSDEFYDIDYDWVPKLDRCMDITKGLRLPEGILVAGAYSHHCLEHIPFAATIALTKELRRHMKKGAVFRVVVPDGEKYCRGYVRSAESGKNETPYGSFYGREGFSTPMINVNVAMREHGHLFIYDFETFRQILLAAGFSEVVRCSLNQGRDTRLLFDVPEVEVESLYLEAIA